MTFSRDFLRDLAYLANYCGWTTDEIEQVKAEIDAHPNLQHYWSVLAQAHRDGYVQTKANGYLRLVDWFAQKGRPNPFVTEGTHSNGIGKSNNNEYG